MALRDAIGILRDRALSDLNGTHDYFADTISAWDIVHKFVAGGNTFAYTNEATSTVTTQANLATKAIDYVAGHLTEATFQQFISIFENFFFDLLRLWLTAYPQSLAGKQVSFRDILDEPDKDAITLLVVNRELNEVSYKKPLEWFVYLEGRAKLGCPTAEELDRFTEAKASRDVLTHNRDIANKVYETKAGMLARYKEGEKIEIPEPYHRETWELMRKLVTDLSNAAIAKAP